ncbi:MAG TPA: hypothetical protein VFZ83_05855 [Acidimicrobiia bacterium]|nr:hypothetical protein [Acidimicrobiia bacterium]
MVDVHLVTCRAPVVEDADLVLLERALADRGIDARAVVWDDPGVDWAAAPVTIVRSTWDYTDRLAEFRAWIDVVAARSALWNPAPLLHWNAHKSYLLSLHARGAPVVPTVVVTEGGAASLDAIGDAQDWDEVVVKPAVGVGANGAGRFRRGDAAGQQHLDVSLTRGDVLVQPFVDSIVTRGEVAIVRLDGAVTHAVCKRPAPHDYRVQENYGGRNELIDPTPVLVELAERVVGVLPVEPLYARIDVVELAGTWHVLEVEVLEPSLWLDLAPPAALERFADAVVRRLP